MEAELVLSLFHALFIHIISVLILYHKVQYIIISVVYLKDLMQRATHKLKYRIY